MSYKCLAPIGWRARIGVISPAVGMAVTHDFHRIAPEGVALLLTQVSEPLTEDTVEQLTRVGDYVDEAAKKLVRPQANVVLWNTTTGSLMKGYGYDRELIKRIEAVTQLPAMTTATAMLQAFATLGVKRISLGTAYVDAVNEREKKFLVDNGIDVVRYKGLQLLDIRDILNVAPHSLYRLGREVNVAEADAVFISCCGMSTADIIEPLERDLGKPVLSSNIVSLWAAMRLAGIRDQIQGFGRLLREH
jgi:maleate isomerase